MAKPKRVKCYLAALLLFATLNCFGQQSSAQIVPAQAISRNIKQTPNPSPPVKIHFQRRSVIPNPTFDKQQTKQATLSKTNLTDDVASQVSQLNRHDRLLINKAKRYFDKNWNETTGLIDSVQGYSHATMWDVASGIAGLLALEALEMSSQQSTHFRLEKMLNTLIKLPLYKNILPNRQYNTRTALPSGRMSQTSSNGNGWSALDLGRLYIWLEILKRHKPYLIEKINQVQNKWQLERATKQGNLYGTKLTAQREYFRQEGRLGYLQYAATGYRLAGLNVDTAFECYKLESIDLEGISLLIDQGNLPFFTLDPYVLYAIELGYQDSCWNQLQQLYKLHKQHAATNNRLVAFAEDSLSKSPWFLYNNIIFQGSPWQSVSHSGKPINDKQTFSNKAAFAMSVLFDEPYSQQLADLVISNSARHTVIPTGLYANGKTNTAYNINTNSLILVSLWYKSRNKQSILLPDNTRGLQAEMSSNKSRN
ncbi:DUF3131 domain-containing protein [Shewanella sp. 10N.261.52.F9]|uniref:DUF3131 domain-containing protein n=1 Tax=Shewanella sp. 10N.261.52.F9 TaxID=3229684 RepID=UPI00354EB959